MKLLLLSLFISTMCFGSNLVRSIDLPYGEVSGIATDPDYIWVMCSTPDVIFLIDQGSGVMLASIPYTATCTDPVGLAQAGGVLYFAEENTPTLWSMSESGTPLDSWDLSAVNPEITSISGIGFNSYTFPGTNDDLLIADNVSRKIFLAGPLDMFTNVTEWIDVSELDEVGDVSCHSEDRWDAMVCYGTGEVSFWTPPGFNFLTFDYGYEGLTCITTMAQDHSMGSSFEFAWVYDQGSTTLWLVYHGMAVEQSTWGGIKADL